MILSMEAVRKISRNCKDIHCNGKKIYFDRFTDKQYEVYKNVSDGLRIRSVCPSGVCLDFYTDSAFIRFNFSINGMARDCMCFDLYVDDMFIESISQKPIVTLEGEVNYSIPGEKGKMKHVTIYLPHLVEIAISDIELSDHAHLEETPLYEKSILCLGDSITQGMVALHPASTYPVLLSRFFGMNLMNHGVGGYVFNKISLDETLPINPDIITVAYGTNDWNKCATIEEYTLNVKEFMDKLTEIYPEAKVFVITPTWREDMGNAKTMGSFDNLGDVIRKVCSEYRLVHVVDGLTLVPNMPRYFGDAWVHPNEEGFLYFGMNLIKMISKSI